MKSFYQSLLVLVLSVLYLNSSAQLNFTPTSNTATITTALQGRGVTISGLTIGGNGAAELANSIGTFTAGKSNLAFPNIRIASGLVITTGSATNATDSTSSVKGPNNHMGISLGDPLPTISTDNDLDQVTTFDKFDLRYITFTIVPDGNILTGTIVFASEEYPTYVGSAFNDACAIIIDGPGIVNNGGYTDLDANVATNSRNLAVFSSGNSLAINEVNSGTPGSQNDGITTINTLNSDFYIRNYTNTDDAVAIGNEGTLPNLQANGFTKPMTFKVGVTPGLTYTMKIVIADVGDGSYDSEMFFKALSSNSGQIDFGDLPAAYDANDQHIVSDNASTPGALAFLQAGSHLLPAGASDLYLGVSAPDAEANGQPSTLATGDGLDELGITFANLSPVSSSLLATIPYYNNTAATANIAGWMDINNDGIFTASEGLTTTAAVTNGAGIATLNFTGLSGLTLGDTYFMRFRITSELITTSDFGDEFVDGEVEDYVLTVSAVLPVRLVSFTGTVNNCTTNLNWKTTSEINNKSYTIQHSSNGINFTSVGEVASQNSINGATYQYNYDAATPGNNFFRLLITDIDGRITYSNVIKMAFNCGDVPKITLAPNPVSDYVSIKGLSGTNTITIMNAAGNRVNSLVSINNTQTIYTGNLQKGTYFIRIMDNNGKESNLKMIKN